MYVLLGDSLQVLKDFPDNSIDAVVTDPPYGLSFMGKKWDYDVPSKELWAEVLRVLKPGGHLLSFGGTRTYHRMVVAIEDAGFEIRDQVMWIYGSGFPKSLNVSIAIDKQAGAMGHRGKALDVAGPGERSDIRTDEGSQSAPAHQPITNAAIKWQGWGTALKPANEPIVLARKPLEKGLTVAGNVLKWGTGALNIDGGRIAGEYKNQGGGSFATGKFANSNRSNTEKDGLLKIEETNTQGRWPANVLFDESAAEILDEQSGRLLGAGNKIGTPKKSSTFFADDQTQINMKYDNGGGASRFFYVAKASKRERNAGLEGLPEKTSGAYGEFAGDGRGRQTEHTPRANHHPTVKPIKLMEYLCKLITPPGGVILDPFCGSGSTGVAAKNLGFEFIGIEREAEYVAIAEKRMAK